ncbi:MAG: DUF2786 domain-containing protein [Pseudonocardia sp.]|jgi:hypothetical protein|uniref:DUF2786 domain-containing protein n=1 Tax=Pseudonocardia sp. TaxID=60912 RepID=UPI001AC2EF4C|nr:DUF2786 domain-containing protein [Pseudonocardia sp.]MBN9102490.1 DUF2786 domain-containing protein [Pseudonocardia sp.]
MGTDKLDVVRKLLAKADRAATPEEAQTYTAKAVELMARHGIDAALVDAARPGHDEIGGQQIPMDDPYSAGKARLLAWTASALRCRAILHEAWGGKVAAVTLFGFASDRERVELLYTSLLLQAGTQLLRQRPRHRGESVAAYRRSWLHGFAVEVHRRLVEAESSAVAERPAPQDSGRSVALVLADRTDRVDRAYAEAFPGVGRARRATLSGSGFGAGAAAGERADLGRDSVGSGRQRALGA